MKSVKIAVSAMVVRLHADHVRGKNSPGSKYVMKELMPCTLERQAGTRIQEGCENKGLGEAYI